VGEWVTAGGGMGGGRHEWVGHLGFKNAELTAARRKNGRLLSGDLDVAFDLWCLRNGRNKREV